MFWSDIFGCLNTVVVQTEMDDEYNVLTTQSSKIGTLKLGRQSKNELKSAVMDVAYLCKCMTRP